MVMTVLSDKLGLYLKNNLRTTMQYRMQTLHSHTSQMQHRPLYKTNKSDVLIHNKYK